jgi:hypothetical protein
MQLALGGYVSFWFAAGFKNVKRLDDVFYQPVIVGTKST